MRSAVRVAAMLCLMVSSVALVNAQSESPTLSYEVAQYGPDPQTLPTMTVIGIRRPVPKSELSEDQSAYPASVTVYQYSDERKRSARDYSDLLKPITGVSSNNFDQGVGYGLTLRGFSERSNGANTAVHVDGVPLNQTSHTLSNGYVDMVPLVPELIERLVLVRGPFDVRAGANALGGSVQITTSDRPPSGAVATGGSYDYWRGAGFYSFGRGSFAGYVSAIGSTMDGYRDNSWLDQLNTFDKFLFPLPGGTGSLRVQLFGDKFGSPGYLNKPAVESGALSPRTAVNPTDGGNSNLQNVTFNYRQAGEQPITALVYFTHTDIDRYSSRFTTTPFNPDGPGQALQIDNRKVFGATAEKYFRFGPSTGAGFDVLVGAGVRNDIVDSARFETRRRVPTPAAPGANAQTEDTHFTLLNPFAYAQLNYKPVAWAKLTAGVRYDHLYYDIEDRTRRLFVDPDLGIAQPKLGVTLSPLPGFDVFANFGRGFRTPSAIGGQELAIDPNADVAKIETKEIGVQYDSAEGVWHFLASAYRTEFTNELQGRPAPLTPLSLGPSKRDGYDIEARVRLYRNGGRALTVFANYSKMDGELTQRTTPGTDIPDIAEWLAKYGFDVAFPLPRDGAKVVTFALSHVFEGPRSLEPTGAFRTKRYSRIDATLGYTDRNWKGFSAFAAFIVYPDRRFEETAFLFGTPPAIGVSPKPRWTIQGGVFVPF